MATLRAGLVGLGMMGRNHARILNSLDGVALVGVADAAGDVAGVAGGAPVVGTVDELIEIGIDLCVVAAPTVVHEEVALRLAEAGVHALVEKPLAQNPDAAARVAAAFAAAGLVGAVGHIERYNPALQNLRQRLEAGEVGAVYQVQTRRQGPFPNRISDVGVVKDLATHDVDLTAWVTQSPFSSITARVAYKSGREHEDLVAATGVLADGTVTNHLVNWLSPLKERMTIVIGEKGCYVADTLSADLTLHKNGSIPTEWEQIARFRGVSEGDVIRYAIAKPEPLRVELEKFRDAVLGKDTDIVTMHEGVRAVAVAEAMLSSAATGTTVDLDAA
jgi:predicted dehydrogenase